MNKQLLKLLVECSDEYGAVDTSKLKSSYSGNSSLSEELYRLSNMGYISILDSDDEIVEIELNQKAKNFFSKR